MNCYEFLSRSSLLLNRIIQNIFFVILSEERARSNLADTFVFLFPKISLRLLALDFAFFRPVSVESSARFVYKLMVVDWCSECSTVLIMLLSMPFSRRSLSISSSQLSLIFIERTRLRKLLFIL